MNKELVHVIGSTVQDNLIAKLVPTAETFGIRMAAGEGKLERGTVLFRNADNTYSVYGKAAAEADPEAGESEETTSAVPSCILADPVDATDAAATAVAYRSGNFNRAALIFGSDTYVITADDEDALRKYDIILTDMQ